MAGVQHIGADYFAALDKYVQDASEAAQIASEIAVETLRESVVEDARQHSVWDDAADSIEVWNDKRNRLRVGVRNPETVDAAKRAEFGTRDNPPAPVIRNNRAAVYRSEQALRYHFGRLTGSLR